MLRIGFVFCLRGLAVLQGMGSIVVSRAAWGLVFVVMATKAFSDGSLSAAIDGSGELKLERLTAYYGALNENLKDKSASLMRDPFQQLIRVREPVQAPQKTGDKSVAASASLSNASSVLLRTRSLDSISLPSMQFKGYLRTAGRHAALLDIQGVGSIVVKEGDKVGLGQVDQEEDAVLKVLEISQLNVVVEVGSLGERLVVQ